MPADAGASGAGARPSRGRSGPRLGLRREFLILLPVSLLLLVLLATFTLFGYRNALNLLAQETRDATVDRAFAAARHLQQLGPPSTGALRIATGEAQGAALLRPDGTLVAAIGDLPPTNLLTPLTSPPPLAVGPSGSTADRILTFVPLDDGLILRLDVATPLLSAQLHSLKVLFPVVLGIESSVVLLALFFLRHLMAPIDTLLARARELEDSSRREGQDKPTHGDEVDDEVALLLRAFDRAIQSQVEGSQKTGTDGEEREEIEALSRTLAPSLESGVLLLDLEGKILALNPNGVALLGLDGAPVGESFETALAAHPGLVEVLREVRSSERAVSRRESPAADRTLGLAVHPLRRDDGAPRGVLALFTDLTEIQRRAEESRLSESLVQLGELAAGIAHELRNSLATLRGYLTLIERRPEEESLADYLGEIRHEADHLQRVLEDFLAFARPGTARLEPIDPAALLHRVASDPALDGAAARVIEDTADGEPPKLLGDGQLLERALRNLVRNAVEAERDAGRSPAPVLRLVRHPEHLELLVEDRGPGIPPEIRERLFQPFASGKSSGVGLGLAISRRILDLHGGTLTLEDRSDGGTLARTSFPKGKYVTESN